MGRAGSAGRSSLGQRVRTSVPARKVRFWRVLFGNHTQINLVRACRNRFAYWKIWELGNLFARRDRHVSPLARLGRNVGQNGEPLSPITMLRMGRGGIGRHRQTLINELKNLGHGSGRGDHHEKEFEPLLCATPIRHLRNPRSGMRNPGLFETQNHNCKSGFRSYLRSCP